MTNGQEQRRPPDCGRTEKPEGVAPETMGPGEIEARFNALERKIGAVAEILRELRGSKDGGAGGDGSPSEAVDAGRPTVGRGDVFGRIGRVARFEGGDPEPDTEDRVLHFKKGLYTPEWDAVLSDHGAMDRILRGDGCGFDIHSDLGRLNRDLWEGKIQVGDVLAFPYYGSGGLGECGGVECEEPVRFLPFNVVEAEGKTSTLHCATLHCRFALASRRLTKRIPFADGPSFPKNGFGVSEARDFCDTLLGRFPLGFRKFVVDRTRTLMGPTGVRDAQMPAWIASRMELDGWYGGTLDSDLYRRRLRRRHFDAWEFGEVRWWIGGERLDGPFQTAVVADRFGCFTTEMITEHCGVVPALTISAHGPEPVEIEW